MWKTLDFGILNVENFRGKTYTIPLLMHKNRLFWYFEALFDVIYVENQERKSVVRIFVAIFIITEKCSSVENC